LLLQKLFEIPPCIVVDDFIFWLDKRLVDGLSAVVDDGDAGQLVADRRGAHFAVESINLEIKCFIGKDSIVWL